MRSKDLQDNLASGFEVGPLPPIGTDGAPMLAPQRPMPDPPPRLCEAGPCAHYHRLEVQLEAEDPKTMRVPVRLPVLPAGATSVPDGMIYQPPASFHTEVHHACYPHVGIEIELGPAPVIQCNRWRPAIDVEREQVQQEFLSSPRGVGYQNDVRAWQRAMSRAQEVDAAVQAEIATALSAYNTANAARDAEATAALESHNQGDKT